jgi:hypothetical protein
VSNLYGSIKSNLRYDGSVDSRGQVEEGPKGAKDELDQEPRDDVKLFADVHLKQTALALELS